MITAGATITGTYEPDLLWQGASLGIFADQPLTVYFEQSSDGTTTVQQDVNTYNANSTGTDASRMYNLLSNYHRVRVTNTGASNTTTLAINCYGVPNWVPTPGRALTQAGNSRCEVPEKARIEHAHQLLHPFLG